MTKVKDIQPVDESSTDTTINPIQNEGETAGSTDPANKEENEDDSNEVSKEVVTEIQSLMDKHKVNQLFENSKGEYFTSLSLAHLSEGGKKEKVKTHNKV